MKIIQIIQPCAQLVALRPFQIQIIGHKLRRIDGAGAITAQGGDVPVQVHDRIAFHTVDPPICQMNFHYI